MSTTPPSFTQAEYIDPSPGTNAPERADPSLLGRAILFGIGGAIAGAICFTLFVGLTHINIGYLSVLIAYLVAKTMTVGSRGQGGRAYQITAVLLTYLAVVAARSCIVAWDISREGTHLVYTPRVILVLIKYGFEYPVLQFEQSPVGALLGLFILFIGLRAAWRMCSGIPGAVRHPFAR